MILEPSFAELHIHLDWNFSLESQSHTNPEGIPIVVETDFRDIKSQEHVRRALEVAAAGGHKVFTRGTTVQVL